MKKEYLVIMLMFLGWMVSCNNGSQSGGSDGRSDGYVHSVQLIQPVSQKSQSVRSFSGVVKEDEEINLGFKTSGQIEHIYVKEGDYVKKGQVIAQLDPKDYQLNVQSTRIHYNQMKTEVNRMRQLYRENSLSGNDFDKAEAQLKDLKVQLDLGENKLDYTTLKAPVDGYVKSVNIEKAEMVNAGTAVIHLINVEQMEVECDIPASLYMKRNLFTGYSCTASVLPNEEFPLKLISIVPQADGTQLYRTRLQLPLDAGNKLTAGMNVEINIHLDDPTRGGRTFTVPLNAVFNSEGKDYVWIMEPDSTVNRCEVILNGIDSHGRAVISGSLTENSNVVKAGVNALQENQKVQVINQPSKTNIGGLL